MSMHRTSIRSGETRLISDYLPEWLSLEEDAAERQQFFSWETLQEAPNLYQLLQRLRRVPFYRYMTRYLLGRYPEECRGLADAQGCPADRWQEALAQLIFAEIELDPPKKSKLLQNQLTKLVLADFIAHGFEIGAGSVAGSLTDNPQRWSAGRLREVLFADTISERHFFVLALGMQMAPQDLACFLQKVLLRGPLNPWVAEEGLLQLCIACGTGNLLQLYRELSCAYSHAPAKAAAGAQTDAGQLMQEWIRRNKAFYAVTPDMHKWLAKYKALLTHHEVSPHPGNQRFLQLYQELTKALEEEVAADSIRELPAGTVQVYCRPGEHLTIPAGTRFCDKSGQPLAASTQRVSTLDSGQTQTVEFEVWSVKPAAANRKEIEKRTAFTCQSDACAFSELKNKSKIKAGGALAPDGQHRLRATLVGTCSGSVDLPAETVFHCGKQAFINLKPISLSCMEVPVEMLPDASFDNGCETPHSISRNTLQQIVLPEKDLQNVLRIEHPLLSCRRSAKQDCSRLIGFLYRPWDLQEYRDNRNAFSHGQNTPVAYSAYAALLQPVLEGTRLTDTRRSQIKNQGTPTVKRHELLTVAFLYHMTREQMTRDVGGFAEELCDTQPQQDAASCKFCFSQNAEEQALAMQTFVNQELQAQGFHPLYLPNPYDCLLAYLSLCEDPLYAYQNIWGILLGSSPNEEGT